MKDKSYTIFELQRLYLTFLCDKSISTLPDMIDTEDNLFISREFLTWLKEREAGLTRLVVPQLRNKRGNKMINILCKLLGHKWSNRGLIKTIDGEEKVVFKCKRCDAERISSFTLVGPTRKAVGRLTEEI